MSEPFLLAAQMEPLATAGEPDTETSPTHVWVLFGKLTLSPDVAERTGDAPPLETAAGAWQAWSLDLPAQAAQGWLRTRRSDADDGLRLRQWLAKAQPGGEVRLRSVMSGSSTLGKSSRLTDNNDLFVRSVVKWNDSTGFEPTHNDRIFRPCEAEDDEFSRRYELNLQTSGIVLPPGGGIPWQLALLGHSQPLLPWCGGGGSTRWKERSRTKATWSWPTPPTARRRASRWRLCRHSRLGKRCSSAPANRGSGCWPRLRG
ncbi:hypothetical protein [Verrucomicrobium spinosum]|uniref:hypothetical protein n=1 Tax=Verrucomicrobium spinosum TaxID=2736 RepID=UPI0012E1601C|nr:hypothetical protein [Verrucomicrobium spinosum]